MPGGFCSLQADLRPGIPFFSEGKLSGEFFLKFNGLDFWRLYLTGQRQFLVSDNSYTNFRLLIFRELRVAS